MNSRDPDATAVGRASTIGGLALALLAVLSVLAYVLGIERLVVPDDAALTAANVGDSEVAFRLAVVGLLAVAVLDIVVAWALYTVFEPVDRRLSALAAAFRVVFAGVFVVAVGGLAGVLGDLSDGDAVVAGVEAFETVWETGLVVFGIHLILLGALVWRAGYAPTLIGILLVVAGAGYLVDGVGTLLSVRYDVELAMFTFVGEVALVVWLLVRGRRLGRVPTVVE